MNVTIGDIEAAARRVRSIVVRTPLLRNDTLDAAAGGRVFVKPECLQVTGSFKLRGAYNLLSQLSAKQATRGVVAWSSGNHAQGVAAAGSMLGIRTTVIMPADAPRTKLENTRTLGGEVITYDRFTEDRESIARTIAAERGGCELVPAYDHRHIVAGQGTVGLEIAEQCAELGTAPDHVLIPCGGGGLSAGCAIALTNRLPGTNLHIVEPEGFDDTVRSLRSGVRERNASMGGSICDALLVPTPGEMTFAIHRALATKGTVVTDDQVKEAMRFAFRHLKLVVEPGGAAALAAILSGRIGTERKTVVIVLSGGNVDSIRYAEILAE